jgi:hypothetical protein
VPLAAFSVPLDRIEEGFLYQADGSFPLPLSSSGIKSPWRPTVITALGFRGQAHLLRLLPSALNALQEPARGEPETAQSSAKPIDAFTTQRVMKQPPPDQLGLF